VTSDYVNISGFNVTGATGNWKAGIYPHFGDHCNISDNTASGSYYGILLDSSSYNTLTNNTANSNDIVGIRLSNADYNNIISNGNYNSGTGGWEWNFYNGQSDAVVAEHNYWVATTNETIEASIRENTGSVDYHPSLNEPGPCAPVPEAVTIILFSIGLLVLAGYVVLRWRRK